MSQHDYLTKAAMYDLLSGYYKYTDPAMYVHYYHKHLKYMRLALQAQRADMTTSAQPSYVRVLHAVPDAPNVDVYVNGNRVLRDVAFKDVSDYLTLPAGKYHIDVYPAGTSVTTVISKKVKIDPGKIYTLAAVGTLNKMQLLPYLDDPTVPSGETKVKFIHLSPDAPAVDIAVKGGDVIFPDISFKQATDYLGLTPMTVNLEARVAGSKNSVLSVPNVKFEQNQAYTIVAVGLANGTPELEAILLKG
ncbi:MULTISPECIES: DUF4397 domain-containing protein [Bacillaceae]|uniref:DUF4397 domain-containing protein n=1 Tax=Bacillaceae TaxID=186817 RepID=UPI001C5710CF|nr:DUF4397 domain-containing protein [Rossellomorea sp. YZS02]MBW3113216.1 DUF4397 domain-containing protein [Bacillus sp. MCCB 382]MDX8343817.1 DUF4397 domain-containing protein [Rossellomorea sp. YZS02]